MDGMLMSLVCLSALKVKRDFQAGNALPQVELVHASESASCKDPITLVLLQQAHLELSAMSSKLRRVSICQEPRVLEDAMP